MSWLGSGLMILGVPLGAVAVAVAFWRGTGIAMAWIAYMIVAGQAILLSLLLSMQLGPTCPVATLLVLVLLGGMGVYRIRNPVPQVAFVGASEVRRRVAGCDEAVSPFAEFAEVAATPPTPTTEPIEVEQVIGRWQYYCDATCRTVVLVLRDDGSYTQTVMDNRGDIVHHPGGMWWLDGPNVEVSGYVTADDQTIDSLVWPMIDTPAGLRLFGGDPGAFFVMTRRA